MQDITPLYVDIDLPEGALLRDDAAQASVVDACHPNDAQAIWYHAHAPAMTFNAQKAMTQWAAENGLGTPARPVDPNDDNATLLEGGGVAFTRGVNCGFVVDAALVEQDCFCLAIRVTSPDAEARSLLTVNPDASDNYLFLSESEGRLIWRDDAGMVEVSIPAPGKDYWVLAGFDKGQLHLTAAPVGDVFPIPQKSTRPSAELAAELNGVADLFIGCRSHRKGILKTLGTSVVHDVLIWLDHGASTPAALEQVARACRYAEAPRNTGERA